MSAYKNTLTNLLTALFWEAPYKLPGGSPTRAVNALRNPCDPIFGRAHMLFGNSTVQCHGRIYATMCTPEGHKKGRLNLELALSALSHRHAEVG